VSTGPYCTMGLPVEQLDGSRLLCQCTGSSQTVTITPVVRSERTPCHASFGDNYNVMSFGAHRNEPTVSVTFGPSSHLRSRQCHRLVNDFAPRYRGWPRKGCTAPDRVAPQLFLRVICSAMRCRTHMIALTLHRCFKVQSCRIASRMKARAH
jgi:hypothetical protein